MMVLYRMSFTSSSKSELSFNSRVLGRKVVCIERDLDVFHWLYICPRLDLDQLVFLLNISPTNIKRFRNRLLILTRAGCIHTFSGALGKSPIFALLDRGMKMYLKSKLLLAGKPVDEVTFPRITRPRHKEAEKIRRHDIAVSNFVLMQHLSAERHPTSFFVNQRDIYKTAREKSVQKLHKWPVIFSWQGQEQEFWLEPDYFGGTGFSDRLEGNNVRYHPLEIDCSSEDLKPNTPLDRGQSILRKLLSYEATIELGLCSEFFGIDFINPLFVFESQRRCENVVSLAIEILTSRKAKEQIFFGLQPASVTAGNKVEFSDLPWIDGRGREVTVRL